MNQHFYFSFPVSKELWTAVQQISKEEDMDLNATARSFLQYGIDHSKAPQLAALSEPQFCEACEE